MHDTEKHEILAEDVLMTRSGLSFVRLKNTPLGTFIYQFADEALKTILIRDVGPF